jgi:hypothetical protein
VADESDTAPDDGTVNVFGTVVERDDRGWCVTTVVDGRRHVVSRHDTRAQAEQAAIELNASGNRTPPR